MQEVIIMPKKSCFKKIVKHGATIYDSRDKKTKIMVDKFYPDAHVDVQTGWQVHVFNIKEAKKGYPHSKVGVARKEAFSAALKYIKKNGGLCKD